jgi:Ca-activated chloride channel homolog
MKKSPFNRFVLFFCLLATIFLFPVYAQQTKTKTLFVSVLDSKSKPVRNLSQSVFTVLENKEAQTITSISSEDKAISVGILFDVSLSFADRTSAGINLARHGLLEFVKASNPLNEYFIMGFDDQTKLVTDWTSDENKIVDGLNRLPSFAKTCSKNCSKIYDAFSPAIEKLNKSRHSKRVLLIITDGYDQDSKYSQKDLMKFVKAKDVLIYPIILSNPGYGPQVIKREYENDFMNQLSELTGGYKSKAMNPRGDISEKAFNKVNIEFKLMFETIASILRSQYEVTYEPTNAGTVKTDYKIKLELKLPSDLKKQVGKFVLYHRLEYANEN